MYLDDGGSVDGDADADDAIMNFCFCSSEVGERGRFANDTDDVTSSIMSDVSGSA